MLRIYWSLIRELPGAFRDAAEAWGFWVWTIGAPALVLLNPQLDRWINTPQFSRRYVAVPIALSVGYVMLRANYRRVEEVIAAHTARPITREDWMKMADLFRAFHSRPSAIMNSEVRAPIAIRLANKNRGIWTAARPKLGGNWKRCARARTQYCLRPPVSQRSSPRR